MILPIGYLRVVQAVLAKVKRSTAWGIWRKQDA